MQPAVPTRVTLDEIRRWKSEQRKFAVLTAYDFPTAAAAHAAQIPSLLVGDTLGCVVLGHPNTRAVALDLMIPLASAVRRGAPLAWLIGDMPYESTLGGSATMVAAAERFCAEAGCDAVKFECEEGFEAHVAAIAARGIDVIAHLGLRPQSVQTPQGYRAQARTDGEVANLVDDCRRAVDAGASVLLLEAIPPEAAQAVVDATSVPVIGCGAGPACDGHVVVTHDMLGFTLTRPPKFVPVLARLNQTIETAMRDYAAQIADGRYPGPEHAYSMRPGTAAARDR